MATAGRQAIVCVVYVGGKLLGKRRAEARNLSRPVTDMGFGGGASVRSLRKPRMVSRLRRGGVNAHPAVEASHLGGEHRLSPQLVSALPAACN